MSDDEGAVRSIATGRETKIEQDPLTPDERAKLEFALKKHKEALILLSQ